MIIIKYLSITKIVYNRFPHTPHVCQAQRFPPNMSTTSFIRPISSRQPSIRISSARASQSLLPPSPLDKKTLTAILCVVLGEPLCQTFIYPYIIYLVLDLNIAETNDEAGFYAGLLIAAFSLAQFCTSMWWGWVCDRWLSKKSVLLFGMLGTTLSLILFGLVRNYYLAITIRVLAGAVNGNMAVSKAAVSEMTDDSNASIAFGWVNLIWSLGAIVGPVIGAMLHHPADTMPSIFPKSGFWGENPYFLPPFISAVLTIAATVVFLAWFDMERARTFSVYVDEDVRGLLSEDTAGDIEGPYQRSINSRNHHRYVTAESAGAWSHKILYPVDATLDPDEAEPTFDVPATPGKPSNFPMIMSIICYCCLALGNNIVDEVYNWWTIESPDNGGLGWTSMHIGVSLAIIGAIDVLFQAFLFQYFDRWFGSVRLFRYSMFVMGPVIAVMPLVSFIVRAAAVDDQWPPNIPPVSPEFTLSMQMHQLGDAGEIHIFSTGNSAESPYDNVFNHIDGAHQAWTYLTLLVLLTIKISAQQCAYTVIMIIINNSTPASSRGWVNGVSQSSAAFVRAVGPALAGWIWTTSLRFSSGVLSSSIVFFLVWFVMWTGALSALFLPRRLDRRA